MKKYRRLFWQIYLPFLVIVLASVLILTLYNNSTARRFFLEEKQADLEAAANMLREEVARQIAPLNPSGVDELCKTVGRGTGIRITVIMPSGVVVGDSESVPEKMENHSERPEINKALGGKVGHYIHYSETLGKEMMYVAIPLEHRNRTLGVIRASVSVETINREIGTIRFHNAVAGLLIALIGAGINLYIVRRISRPIEIMRLGAGEFASGNLAHRLPTSGSEEMGLLAKAMNRMARELEERMKLVSQQRNELESVLCSMLEGVIALNTDERIININPAASRMFQRDPSQIIGKTIQEIIRNPELHRFVARALSVREPLESEITLHYEGECILSTQSTPLQDASGIRMGTLLVFHDITRLRLLENMRRDFAANVSHELRTPLTAIKGFVETLQHGAMDNREEAERFLQIIEKHTDRLNTIIEDLMKLSEIEQREQNGIPLETGPLQAVLQNAIEICRTRSDEKKIRIEMTCPPDLAADINAPLFEQAAANLVDNAVKYSPANSTIRISAIADPAGPVIRFEDEGIGIPAESIPRLFERFYRVDKSRSRKQGGTGLGLAIVKHIVQAHNGRISVSSVLEKGTVFEIRLPEPGTVSRQKRLEVVG